MMTLILIAFPFLAGFLILTNRNYVIIRNLSIGLSLIQLVLTAVLVYSFDPQGGMQFIFQAPWVDQLGINWNFGIDGISLLMILLTNLLIPFILFSGDINKQQKPNLLYALIFFTQAALIGVFTSFNAIVFYIFWELALIPVFFILFLWGGERRQPVTLKFFIYTLFGSLFMLAVFIFLYSKTPTHSFDHAAFTSLSLKSAGDSWVFFMLAVAFFIKIPLFPFHSWQPQTYTTAPYQGTMILAGLLMKMGIYGIIRWLVPVMPYYTEQYSHIIIFLPLAGMIYASVIALRQNNLKMLIAWSSLAHAGLMGAAIFARTNMAIQGVLLQSFSHGILIVALFYFVQLIEERTGTSNLERLGGIRNIAPIFSGLMLIIVLGSIGLPLTNGFPGEFLMIAGLFPAMPWYSILGGMTLILGAVYMLYAYQRAMLGELNLVTANFPDLKLNEKLMIIPLVALVILFGIFPQLLLNLTENSVQDLLNITFSYK
ncbi:MAG: NADH-quinone oxidoreductase subunit M [Bacteroidota bacterium]